MVLVAQSRVTEMLQFYVALMTARSSSNSTTQCGSVTVMLQLGVALILQLGVALIIQLAVALTPQLAVALTPQLAVALTPQLRCGCNHTCVILIEHQPGVMM